MADREFFQSAMLLRKVCRGILRSMCLPTRWCRARASEWLRSVSSGIPPNTAPEIAAGLRMEGGELIFVDKY